MVRHMRKYLFRIYSLALGGLTAGVALAASVAPAQAALLSTSTCDTSTLTQPFLPWGDANAYKLVPGGSFETGTTGWTLKGGAGLATGSEPYGAAGSVGSWSLYLPAGASAQSPYTCVNAAYPLLRFFARTGGLLSTVTVELVYQDPILGSTVIPVGAVALSGTWQPSLSMLTLSAVPGALNGGTAQVAVKFIATTGASRVDDVFIDPRMTG
jgi:hypothetical protein